MHAKGLTAAPLLVLAAVAMASSACSATAYGASVGSVSISQATVISQAEGLEAFSRANGVVAPSATSPGTVSTRVLASVAKTDVANLLEKRILSRKGVKVDDIERRLVRSQILSQAPPSLLKGAKNAAFMNYLVDSEAANLALEATLSHVDLSSSGIRAYYQSHRVEFTKVCFVYALYGSLAGAQAAQSAIAGGETFAQATTAAQGGSGGTPQCAVAASIQSPLRAALLGTPPGHVGPVETVTTTSSNGQAAQAYGIFQVVSSVPQTFAQSTQLTVAEAMLSNSSPGSTRSKLAEIVKIEALSTPIRVNPADGKLVVGKGQQLGFDVTTPSGPPASALPSTTTTIFP